MNIEAFEHSLTLMGIGMLVLFAFMALMVVIIQVVERLCRNTGKKPDVAGAQKTP